MALKITEDKGIFILDGPINSETVMSLKSHLDYLTAKFNRVTINIDKVNEIDVKGMSILRQFHLNSFETKSSFSIVGFGCKEIYDDFNLVA